MKFTTRFGKTVEFEPKPKIWKPLVGESFWNTATRIYYPKKWKRILKEREELYLATKAW